MYKIVKGANLSPRELFFFPSKRAKYYKRLALTRWGIARHEDCGPLCVILLYALRNYWQLNTCISKNNIEQKDTKFLHRQNTPPYEHNSTTYCMSYYSLIYWASLISMSIIISKLGLKRGC